LTFERSQKDDRLLLSMKMKDHISDPNLSPLLVFPEGTCVNNEYTVLFQKGAFEMGSTVCPVAIKYDKSWADAFWHTRTQTFSYHLFYLMTRWKLVADVWYLRPRTIRPGQTAIDFANEVKAEISETAGLKNLSWDGYWKNFVPSAEKREKLKDLPRNRYAAILAERAKKSSKGLTRRLSYTYGVNTTTDEFFSEWESQTADTSTSIKNHVLVSLQNQERKNLKSSIIEKKRDIADTWKKSIKRRSNTSSIEDLNFRRIQNLAWRLWFQDKMKNRLKGNEYSSFLSSVTEYFPVLSARIHSPLDLYESDVAHLQEAPLNTSPKRLFTGFHNNSTSLNIPHPIIIPHRLIFHIP